jgi:preprotein translocase subunit SecA
MLDSNFQEGDVLEHPLLNRSIESAQKKVEAYNYSVRRRLLQYDDMLNKQREIIYNMRNQVLAAENVRELLFSLIEEEVTAQLSACLLSPKDRFGDTPGFDAVISSFNIYFPISLKREDFETFNGAKEAVNFVMEKIRSAYAVKLDVEGSDLLGDMEQYIILNAIDHNWQDHLTEMEELRRSVGLRGYGQKDPLNEYKHEAFSFFEMLLSQIRREVCSKVFRIASSNQSLGLMIEHLLKDKNLLGEDSEEKSDDNDDNDDNVMNLSFDHDDEE